MTHHHDAVEHRNSKERDEPYAGRKIQIDAADPERCDSAYQRQRHDQENQEHLLYVVERGVEQGGDNQNGYREDDSKTLLGAPLVLVLSAPLQPVAWRQLKLLLYSCLGISHEAAEISTRDVAHHNGSPARFLPIDNDRPANGADVSQLIEPDQFTIRSLNLQALKLKGIVPQVIREADSNREALFTEQHLG